MDRRGRPDSGYGAPLAPTVQIGGGDWSDLAGASVVLICAGVNERDGGATDRDDPRGRLKLLETNASVYRDVVPHVVAAAPDAVLVAVTDPPDPLADLTRALARHDRVLSTGTTIDSLRFRVHVAAQLGVQPSAADALIVGEHGTSEVMLCAVREHRDHRGQRREPVRHGIVCARIVEALLGAERVVMPVATYRERYGVTIGLPTVVGRNGAAGVLEPSMSEHERRAVDRSAVTLRDAARRSACDPASGGSSSYASAARGSPCRPGIESQPVERVAHDAGDLHLRAPDPLGDLAPTPARATVNNVRRWRERSRRSPESGGDTADLSDERAWVLSASVPAGWLDACRAPARRWLFSL